MPRFRYVAMDSKGVETQGIIDAENQSQALSIIRSKGFFPTKINEIGADGKTMAAPKAQVEAKGIHKEIRLPAFLRRGVKAKVLMIFTRQLATLVDAGLPLLRGLRILLKQEANPALRDALSGMGESVEGGSTFSEALAQHPKIFDNLFVNMVKAGEAGGVLEVVLIRLAEFMEKAERIKNKIKSAMVYPVVVLVFAMCILTFLMLKVIPKFEEIFRDLLEGNKKLPPLTEFVMGVSQGFVNYWYIVVAVIAGIVILLRLWRQTARGRLTLDMIKLKAPVFGPLFSKTAIARFTRTLGTLMSSGVPVLQALNIVRDTAGNQVVARAVQHIHDSVKEGDTMALPMEASGVFPGMVVSMVDVGEETGALPEMLVKVADNYEDEVDTAVEALTSVIEPIMIIVLAVIIGTIVIAMFIPLITIIGEMSTQ
ncbi:MAG: type II secretion system F family protein [Verrucomicrobiota bacterium]|nr:type II secretion system F family protein [Verrucomicrobiota bacterium]